MPYAASAGRKGGSKIDGRPSLSKPPFTYLFQKNIGRAFQYVRRALRFEMQGSIRARVFNVIANLSAPHGWC